MRLADRYEAMNSCTRMCEGAKAAAEWYFRAGGPDRDSGRIPAFSPRDLRDCVLDLEPTYLVRLFAVFETTLRDYWANAIGRRTRPSVRDLVDGLAVGACPRELHARVHEVRTYRNRLVHGGQAPPPIGLKEAKSSLCKFLHLCLRREW